MEPRAVLLSGEHPTLPAAELRALLDVHDPGARLEVGGLLAVVHPERTEGTDAALRRHAMSHGAGILWAEGPATEEGIASMVKAVRRRADGRGSAAVLRERRGHHKSPLADAALQSLGKTLADAGHPIDLENPGRRFFLWVFDDRLAFGELIHDTARSAHDARSVENRSHFMPVSLHPRLAAALLHLARAPPGSRIYDPFCGTGGFLLEAAAEGYDAWGSDLDAWMVQGTLQALADTLAEPLDGTAFVADVGETPGLVEGVAAIVTDLPYGRASSTDREALPSLYDRAFAAFSRILPAGAHAVVGGPDPALLSDLEKHGFAVVERHEERVHRTLTRHFVVVKRVQGVGRPG